MDIAHEPTWFQSTWACWHVSIFYRPAELSQQKFYTELELFHHPVTLRTSHGKGPFLDSTSSKYQEEVERTAAPRSLIGPVTFPTSHARVFRVIDFSLWDYLPIEWQSLSDELSFTFWVWGLHLAVLGAHSWLCAQGSLLVRLAGTYVVLEIKPKWVGCKASKLAKKDYSFSTKCQPRLVGGIKVIPSRTTPMGVLDFQ